MLSALVAEKMIWGTSPGAWSLAGSALILGAAAMVAMQKSAVVATAPPATSRPGIRPDEEEEAGMQLLHDAELHQIGEDDGDGDDRNDNDIEMIEREKRGRSTGASLTLNDHDEPMHASISVTNSSGEKPALSHTGARPGDEQNESGEAGDSAYLDPPGVWQFAHARHGLCEADRSEDVSPHSPAVQRKTPVFWGR